MYCTRQTSNNVIMPVWMTSTYYTWAIILSFIWTAMLTYILEPKTYFLWAIIAPGAFTIFAIAFVIKVYFIRLNLVFQESGVHVGLLHFIPYTLIQYIELMPNHLEIHLAAKEFLRFRIKDRETIARQCDIVRHFYALPIKNSTAVSHRND